MKSLLRLVQALQRDLKRLNPSVTGLDRDFVTIEARFEHEGISFLTCALPLYGQWFDRSLAAQRVTCLHGFAMKGRIPKFLSGIVCNVFDVNTGLLKDDADIECVKSIREFCYFFKKLTPTDSRLEVLEKRTISEFIKTDQAVVDVDSVPKDMLDTFDAVCRLVLFSLDGFQELDCRHGPGAVAEGYSANQKWIAVTSSIIDGSTDVPGFDLIHSLYDDFPKIVSRRYVASSDASLICVPKTQTSLRTITIEPCLNQFFQQGLNRWLRDKIRKCPILSQSLDLTDQSKNQQLAVIGSRTGEWATIDLSRASDLLSLSLVKRAFASKPRFLETLLKSRTPTVKVGDNVINLNKFAGMGNATTFPIQSVIFALLAICAGLEGCKPSIANAKRVASQVRVYGDDIIVRTPIYASVEKWITSFGLCLNQKKTFSTGNFRESCGVDCFRGYNVTPIYLRANPHIFLQDPSDLASLVSTSNQLWLACRYTIAQYISGFCGKLPLVPQSSGALGWHTRQDATTISRWNSCLHRFEFKSICLSATRLKDCLDDLPALMKFFIAPNRTEVLPHIYTSDVEHLQSSPKRFNIKKRARWLPSR